ncbi:MAG TPA: iron-containing redox enzyme family protein [Oligoflexus sp.]|uniref:iron-containing redox enzyme family protein n=1 Tax=Oligoflexus sp. TaxID=1971216 RepID=UPI002D450AC4|nr:iron-containing redox enzyme family protein [Oligoflexus sp.]HYX34570.1 iron-containing redox enzyme family protein [Oligoflexus sp.]
MSLADLLKKRVELYWAHLKTNDPFNRALLNGTATQAMANHFLVNVRYLVQQTPIHLRKATAKAEKNGEEKLAKFFKLKCREEQGHDRWADSDIAKVNQRRIIESNSEIDPSMKGLVKHIESIIDYDPVHYLAYIFFAEYLCVVAGFEMAEAWEKKCGFPPNSMSVISNHAELDQHHVHEWVDITRDLLDEDKYKAPLLETVEETIKVHQQFYQSCWQGKSHAA